eukprot:5902236-Prymnesium_polylepis.1
MIGPDSTAIVISLYLPVKCAVQGVHMDSVTLNSRCVRILPSLSIPSAWITLTLLARPKDQIFNTF